MEDIDNAWKPQIIKYEDINLVLSIILLLLLIISSLSISASTYSSSPSSSSSTVLSSKFNRGGERIDQQSHTGSKIPPRSSLGPTQHPSALDARKLAGFPVFNGPDNGSLGRCGGLVVSAWQKSGEIHLRLYAKLLILPYNLL